MSKDLGDRLSPELLEKLRCGSLYRPGGTGLPLLTADPGGWPHVSMGPGAVAANDRVLYVAMGGQSQSVQNVQQNGRITLLVAAPSTLYYIKGKATVVRPAMQLMAQEAAVRVEVQSVLEDMEPSVSITTGIGYRYTVMHEEYTTVIAALLDELTALAEEE